MEYHILDDELYTPRRSHIYHLMRNLIRKTLISTRSVCDQQFDARAKILEIRNYAIRSGSKSRSGLSLRRTQQLIFPTFCEIFKEILPLVFQLCERTDKQTDKQTQLQYPHSSSGVRVISSQLIKQQITLYCISNIVT